MLLGVSEKAGPMIAKHAGSFDINLVNFDGRSFVQLFVLFALCAASQIINRKITMILHLTVC